MYCAYSRQKPPHQSHNYLPVHHAVDCRVTQQPVERADKAVFQLGTRCLLCSRIGRSGKLTCTSRRGGLQVRVRSRANRSGGEGGRGVSQEWVLVGFTSSAPPTPLPVRDPGVAPWVCSENGPRLGVPISNCLQTWETHVRLFCVFTCVLCVRV
jgi:hypothetical protein